MSHIVDGSLITQQNVMSLGKLPFKLFLGIVLIVVVAVVLWNVNDIGFGFLLRFIELNMLLIGIRIRMRFTEFSSFRYDRFIVILLRSLM